MEYELEMKKVEEDFLTINVKRDDDGQIYFVYSSNYKVPANGEIRRGDGQFDALLEQYVKDKNAAIAKTYQLIYKSKTK
ncbi:hypothetical protein R0K17_09490 [Planococcus sp. SIMBA_143]